MRKKLAAISILIIVLIGFGRKYDLFSMDNGEPKKERTKRHISRKAQQQQRDEILRQLSVRGSLKRPCDTLESWFINFIYSNAFQYDLQNSRSATFSPDSKLLAIVASDNNDIKIWNVATGQLKYNLPHLNEVFYEIFSSDGKLFATRSGNEAKIWDLATGQLKYNLQHFGEVNYINFSPDDRLFVTSSGNDVNIWDVATGQLKYNLPHSNEVYEVNFSPDSTLFTTRSGNDAKIWDLASGQLKYNLQHPGDIFYEAFSPDGKLLATKSGNDVKIWDVATGQLKYNLQHPDEVYYKGGFSPDSKLFAASSGNEVQIWDLATGKLQHNLRHLSKFFHGVNFSPDSKLFATSLFNNVKIWDVATGKIKYNLRHTSGISQSQVDEVYEVNFSPDSKLLATRSGNDAKIWDIATGQLKYNLRNTGLVNVIAFSPDSEWVISILANDNVKIWNLEKLNNLLKELTMDQCDLLQAFQNTFKKDSQTGKPIGRIQATQEQWHTFKTMPQAIQDALKLRIKKPEQQASKEWTIWNLIKKVPEDTAQD